MFGLKKWLNKVIKEAVESIVAQNSLQGQNAIVTSSSDGLDDTYLFDFKNWQSAYSSSGFGVFTSNPRMTEGRPVDVESLPTEGTFLINTTPSLGNDKTKVLNIKVTPKSVLSELETVPTPFTLMGIDDKISVLKDKEKLITQKYAKREVGHLIERLENRRKYNEHKQFFDSYQNTTDEKIDVLLKKYDHLRMKAADLFIPEFPDDAVKTMTAYTERVNVICGKKPVYYAIADDKDFKKAYEKRDPILLVQSPFGFFWQILGAWDEEMILLQEL